MDWFVFFLVMFNIFINAIVLNSNIKDRKMLANFVETAKVYAWAHNLMTSKYNEVAGAFNSMRKVSDNQADIIEALLTAELTGKPLTVEGLERLLAGFKSARVESDASQQSSDTP